MGARGPQEPAGRGRHRKNTYASETPATDGERLYVYFGNVGLFAYRLDGTPLWNTRFEPQPMYLDFGTASSPVVHDGRVFVLHDNDGKSFAAAIDATTGKVLWQVDRDLPAGRTTSGWSTPFVWKHALRTELVVVGRQHAVGYALDSGKELWRLSGLTGQSTPSPVAANGLLYLATGSQGENNRPVYAVRPGGSGDISLAAGATSNAFVAWMHPRASAYTSSPLVYRGRMYVVNDNGVLTVFDAATGKEIYKARAGGSGNTFSSVAVGRGRAHLSPKRGRADVCHRSGRSLPGAGEEQPGRDEPGLPGAGPQCAVPEDTDQALPHRQRVSVGSKMRAWPIASPPKTDLCPPTRTTSPGPTTLPRSRTWSRRPDRP